MPLRLWRLASRLAGRILIIMVVQRLRAGCAMGGAGAAQCVARGLRRCCAEVARWWKDFGSDGLPGEGGGGALECGSAGPSACSPQSPRFGWLKNAAWAAAPAAAAAATQFYAFMVVSLARSVLRDETMTVAFTIPSRLFFALAMTVSRRFRANTCGVFHLRRGAARAGFP